jgi:hypothetical protein
MGELEVSGNIGYSKYLTDHGEFEVTLGPCGI